MLYVFLLSEPAGFQKEKEEEDRITTGSTVSPQRWRHNRHQGLYKNPVCLKMCRFVLRNTEWILKDF